MIAAEIVRTIAESVCLARGVPLSAIYGRDTAQAAADARADVYAALRERNWSCTRIGRAFGRDHTTIIHALKRRAG
jgi:chromosomal replication initiation ATPase DnaA